MTDEDKIIHEDKKRRRDGCKAVSLNECREKVSTTLMFVVNYKRKRPECQHLLEVGGQSIAKS